MGGTFTNILIHFAFSTKNRERFITPEIRSRLYDYIGGIIKSEKGVLYVIGGTQGHVHLLVRWRADGAISDLMRDLKSRSTLWVHQTFPDSSKFYWQDGYGAFSVSKSQQQRVGEYIKNQERHHKTRDFEQEFVGLLEAHDIEYDKRYIWN